MLTIISKDDRVAEIDKPRSRRMTRTLHTFPFSNYCEKTLWALDHLGLEYATRTHYPGPHARAVARLSGQSAVPVLEEAGSVITDSGQILRHLIATTPDQTLVPDQHATAIWDWHDRLDPFGKKLRGLMFYAILPRPSASIPVLTYGTRKAISGYGLFFRAMTPMLMRMLRTAMPDQAKARSDCDQIMQSVAQSASATGYLVGDRFSLADLTAAALFFPICLPPHSMGAQRPPALRGFDDRWLAQWRTSPVVDYVQNIYARHRLARAVR